MKNVLPLIIFIVAFFIPPFSFYYFHETKILDFIISGILFFAAIVLYVGKANVDLKVQKQINDLISEKFDLNLIHDREDISIILNSFTRASHYYTMSPILEDYLTFGVNQENIEKDITKVEKRYKLIKSIIEEENKSKPFDNVPDEERRLLVAMKAGVEHNDFKAIEFNIHELHTVISSKNRLYNKAISQNKWSVPLAIIGIVLSISFWIISILPLDSESQNEINNPSVDRKEISAEKNSN